MSRTIAAWLGFFGGLVAGYCAVLFGWVAYTNLFDVFDREGAMAMGVAFFFAPVGAVLAGIAGAVWLARRAGRGSGAAP